MSAQEDYEQKDHESQGHKDIDEFYTTLCRIIGRNVSTTELLYFGHVLEGWVPVDPDRERRGLSDAEYKKYLSSPAWKRRRICVLRRANNRCEVCGSKGPIDIHHLSYERVGYELLTDLVALCWECHEWVHKSEKSS